MRHNLRARLFADVDGSVNHGRGLHLGNLRVRDSQAAAAVAHHRVELMQAGNDVVQLFHADAKVFGQLHNLAFLLRQELVQRRIQQPDGHRAVAHHAVYRFEIFFLIRLDHVERLFALLGRIGEDHPSDGRNPVFLEEHVLRAAKADTFGAEFHGLSGVARVVGVGSDLQLPDLVRPFHELGEIAGNLRLHRFQASLVNPSAAAVERNVVALAEDLITCNERLFFFADADLRTTGHTTLAHASGHHGRMRGHASASRQNTFGGDHTGQILRRSLLAHQKHLFTALRRRHGFLSRKVNSAAGRARRSRKAGGDRRRLFQLLFGKHRMQKLLYLLRRQSGDRRLSVDEPFAHHIDRDLHRRLGRALAAPGLEHIQLVVFNRKFHVLDVFIVPFQEVGYLDEVLVSLRERLGHLVDAKRRPHAGDHILALRVDQKLTEDLFAAVRRVARKGYTRAGRVSHVAENHGLDIDSSAQAA